MKMNCPFCGSDNFAPSTFSGEVSVDTQKIEVIGLENFVCSNCGADPVMEDQARRNQATIADAKRSAMGLLTGNEIRQIRELLGLTQQQAANVFGGGRNAFSKYERGNVLQSAAMDKLIRGAFHNPEFFAFLCSSHAADMQVETVLEQNLESFETYEAAWAATYEQFLELENEIEEQRVFSVYSYEELEIDEGSVFEYGEMAA